MYNLLSQFEGCFKNQSILIPIYDSQWSYPSPNGGIGLGIESSFPIANRYWWSMMFFTCYTLGLFMYQIFHIYLDNQEEINKEEGEMDVVDDMRAMMDEISELSEKERQERSENYYILTNLLVNRFRIEVYEKILK
jgi:hypothetical protein